MVSVMRDIVQGERAPGGLFRGHHPAHRARDLQTLFMVTGAKMLKETLKEQGCLEGSGSSGGH